MRGTKLGAFVGGLAVLLGTVTGIARADEVVRTDGKVVRGRIVSETPDALVLEVQSAGLAMRQRVPRALVKSISREAREGPGYCVVPIRGELGMAVTPEALRDAIDLAKQAGATFVVLAFDSDGGDEAAAEDLAKLVRDHDAPGFRVVALVKRATGSAAIVAVACRDIYLLGDARLAADVPAGKTAPSLLRSIRISARETGHHPDWVRGVLETEAEPTPPAAARTTKDGRRAPVVARLAAGGASSGTTATATATAASLDALRDGLGLTAWYEADERPRHVMAYAAGAEERARAKVREAEARREAARRAAIGEAELGMAGPTSPAAMGGGGDAVAAAEKRLADAQVAHEQAMRDIEQRCAASLRDEKRNGATIERTRKVEQYWASVKQREEQAYKERCYQLTTSVAEAKRQQFNSASAR